MNDLPPIQSFEDFEREVAPSAPPTELERLTAARRYRALGKAVSVDFAPAGRDWNDVLMGRAPR